jgi:hypothetical protein
MGKLGEVGKSDESLSQAIWASHSSLASQASRMKRLVKYFEAINYEG